MFPSLSGAPVAAPPISGPPSAPTSGGSYASGQYEEWARRQRPHGTVYGSAARPASQPPLGSPLEHSGSLTGHLLSRGSDAPPSKSRNTRVIVIMTVVVAVLVIAGLIIAVFARNALLDILKGV
jgi:hypothetical protein